MKQAAEATPLPGPCDVRATIDPPSSWATGPRLEERLQHKPRDEAKGSPQPGGLSRSQAQG